MVRADWRRRVGAFQRDEKSRHRVEAAASQAHEAAGLPYLVLRLALGVVHRE